MHNTTCGGVRGSTSDRSLPDSTRSRARSAEGGAATPRAPTATTRRVSALRAGLGSPPQPRIRQTASGPCFENAMTEDPRVIADYIDARVCCQVRSSLPRGVSRQLVAVLESGGVRGQSVLDVGCGTGGLCLALVDRGAASAVGVDLSPRAIDQAARASQERGVADRAIFRVGDGSQTAYEPADVVVLDKVFCCYFDPVALLTNTLPAANTTYAIVLPPSRGVRGALARLAVGIENLGRRLKGDDFRAYVHDVVGLDAAIRDAGFRPALLRRRLFWDIRVYTRTSPGTLP